MNLIAQIINAALNELFEKGVIELPPEEMDTFQAECEIENYGVNEPLYSVVMCGWEIFIWECQGRIEAYFALEQSRASLASSWSNQ